MEEEKTQHLWQKAGQAFAWVSLLEGPAVCGKQRGGGGAGGLPVPGG